MNKITTLNLESPKEKSISTETRIEVEHQAETSLKEVSPTDFKEQVDGSIKFDVEMVKDADSLSSKTLQRENVLQQKCII